jgi:hypothetical protein
MHTYNLMSHSHSFCYYFVSHEHLEGVDAGLAADLGHLLPDALVPVRHGHVKAEGINVTIEKNRFLIGKFV